MPDNQKSVFERIAAEVGQDIGKSLSELRQEFSEAVQVVNKAAGAAALKAEELYDRFDINDRLYGAGLGAKAGGLIGVRGGFHGLGVGVAIGAAAGFAVGHKGVAAFRKWRDGHKEAANDEGPKPPSV